MKSIVTKIQAAKSIILYFTLFLFPLFFLTLTEEFYSTSKLYLLAFAGSILVFLSLASFAIRRKAVWRGSPFDIPLILTLVASVAAALITASNHVQALLEPTTGATTILVLTILYFALTQIDSHAFDMSAFILHPLRVAAGFVAIIALVFFFNPLSHVTLPSSWAFLQQQLFSPLGRRFDLAVFMGFFAVFGLTKLLFARPQRPSTMKQFFDVATFALPTIALVASLILIFSASSRSIVPTSPSILSINPLPPFSISTTFDGRFSPTT